MHARFFRSVLLALSLIPPLGLTGCATKYGDAMPPDIRVVGLKLLPTDNLLDQRFELDLAVGNPNNFGVDIEGLRYVLYLNGKTFATGYSSERVKLDRLSEARIKTVGRTDITKIIRQILALPDARGLDYRIAGDAFLSNFPRDSVSFDKSGAITLDDAR